MDPLSVVWQQVHAKGPATEKACCAVNRAGSVVRRGVICWWNNYVAMVQRLKLDDKSPSDTVGHVRAGS